MPAGSQPCWTISTHLPDERALRADPRLVETWVHGWALARGTPPPVRDSGALRIDVGLPDQKARYVFAQCSENLRRLAERIDEPFVFIKVCSPPDPVRAHLPSRWVIQRQGYMMTRMLEPLEDTHLPPGYRLAVESIKPRLTVSITDDRGDLAARGGSALVDGLAVFDQIRTHEEYRRRGLARAVMNALQGAAFRQGAMRGGLVATPEGRALYDSMGWQLHSLYTRVEIPA